MSKLLKSGLILKSRWGCNKSSLSAIASPYYLHGCNYSWKNFTLEDELTLEIKQSIEKKWGNKVYGVDCPAERKKINKPDKIPGKYILSMFPYPSGRLHLGHVRVYTLSDVLARFHRMQGYHVVHPMGWDAFGLPAENAARDNGVEAETWTLENIDFMKRQIIDMGCCFDWDREFATCDSTYYKWTQWIFIKLWENGLVYKKRAYVYWDPVDKTVLAEEQVDANMRSWRSGAKVEKKLLQQWFVRTAVFAEKLALGLTSGELKHGWRDVVDLQKHWIGDIKGYFSDCLVDISEFWVETEKVVSSKEPLRIWFSNTDSLINAKYFILRPDHFLAENDKFISKRFDSGLKLLKLKIVNPATGKALPVFTGTPEILPIVPQSSDCRVDEVLSEAEYGDISSKEDFLNEINASLKQLNVIDNQQNIASTSIEKFVFYPASLKLRDWLVSRQRKWGTPIPIISCQDCGESQVASELPITNSSSKPSDSCLKCGSQNTQRESDTLDTFFDSSWYFLRFLDSKNEDVIFNSYKVNKNLPVDIYVGGKEHATLHLYYARFMTHFLQSLGLISVTEPFQKLIPVGVVMGEAFIVKGSNKYVKNSECIKNDQTFSLQETGEAVYTKWEKMSKSKHNGIDPELVLKEYGIDTTRLLSMSEVAPTSTRKWPPNNIDAFLNWQKKIWLILRQFVDAKDFGDIVFVDDEAWSKSEAEIFDARNHYLKGINHDYAATSQISVALSKLQALFGILRKVPKAYLKESHAFERTLGASIICLYPIMPAYSAQLWQSFRAVATLSEPEFDLDNEVWEQRWPSVDWKYRLDLVCRFKGEEYVSKVERNYLDNLDQDTALSIVFDNPEVQKLISKSTCEVVNFMVEPAFRATIVLREKKSPDFPNDHDSSSTKKHNSNVKNSSTADAESSRG